MPYNLNDHVANSLTERTGHMPFWERPDVFYPALIGFAGSDPLAMPDRNP